MLVIGACTQTDKKGDSPNANGALPTTGPFAVGAATDGLEDAMRSADLTKPEVLAAIPARLRELAPKGTQPRAASVMLRALIAAKADDAAALGCDLLDRLPAGYGGKVAEPIIDTALMAIANAPGPNTGGACVEAVKKRLGQDRCLAVFRCKEDGTRLAQNSASDQRERLCTADDLKKEIVAELAKPKETVLTDKQAYAIEHFALAAMRAQNAVPPEMEKAHARRRYTLTQSEKPECEGSLRIGTPCHCDEAALRDQVCRNDTTEVSFSVCHANLSDEKKEISGVKMSSPP